VGCARESTKQMSGDCQGARRRRLANVLERIDYDSRRGEVSVCWRAPQEGSPVSFPLRSLTAVRPVAVEQEESAGTTAARVPLFADSNRRHSTQRRRDRELAQEALATLLPAMTLVEQAMPLAIAEPFCASA